MPLTSNLSVSPSIFFRWNRPTNHRLAATQARLRRLIVLTLCSIESLEIKKSPHILRRFIGIKRYHFRLRVFHTLIKVWYFLNSYSFNCVFLSSIYCVISRVLIRDIGLQIAFCLISRIQLILPNNFLKGRSGFWINY